MRVLGLDTATAACSVALWRDGDVVCARSAEMARGHAEALMPMVADVLAAAEARFADVDAVAATVGPGAFTGLRVGLAAARGMALAAGIPCLGATTLEAVAAGVAPREAPILAVVDSRRAELYAQAFSAAGVPLGPPEAVAPEALAARLEPGAAVVVAGDAAARAAEALGRAGIDVADISVAGPDAGVVAALAAGRLRAGAPPVPPVPLYLRPPDAVPARP